MRYRCLQYGVIIFFSPNNHGLNAVFYFLSFLQKHGNNYTIWTCDGDRKYFIHINVLEVYKNNILLCHNFILGII